MTLPRISNYGKGKTKQHNTTVVTVGRLEIYFSYETPVAYWHDSTGLVVRENDWGPTTGKHLNWIDGGTHSQRISGVDFENQLAELTN